MQSRAEYLPLLCAERDADAEFSHAFGDGVARKSKDAGNGKHGGEDPEHTQSNRGRAGWKGRKGRRRGDDSSRCT